MAKKKKKSKLGPLGGPSLWASDSTSKMMGFANKAKYKISMRKLKF